MMKTLDRTINEPSTAPPTPAKRTGPPKEMPPIERHLRAPWPRRARMTVAALSVIALAGIAGTTIQTIRDGDTGDLDAQITQLTEQRDELAGTNEALVSDLAAADLDVTVVSVELLAAESRIDILSGDVAEMQIANEMLSDDVGDLRIANETLSGDVGELELANETLTVDLAAAEIALAGQVELTEATVAERDALAALFPLTVDATLRGQDIVGTYDVEWLPAFNSGLADITLPTIEQLTISRTDEGWLRVEIPGVVSADLARTDGALFTMVDSTTAVPEVNGVARVARVAITVYAGDSSTTVDGVTTVDELGLSIAISTDAVGAVSGGVALYGAELTPEQ